MEISTDQIKDLRSRTGLSVIECKKALEEAEGDQEKALLFLRKKSGEIAAKKSDRDLGAGAVAAYVHSNGTVGALVELASETDFVANNEEFRALAYDIAMHAAAMNPAVVSREEISDEEKNKVLEVIKRESEESLSGKPEDIQKKIIDGKLDAYFKEKALLEQAFIKNGDQTIKDLIESYIHKFGERIEVRRFARYSILG